MASPLPLAASTNLELNSKARFFHVLECMVVLSLDAHFKKRLKENWPSLGTNVSTSYVIRKSQETRFCS